LALVIGTLATAASLALNINDYYNFLVLIGSVFTPLLGVLVVDWFVISRGRWDLGESVRTRSGTLTAWLLGFITYQLINPGYIGWWSRAWVNVDTWLHFTPTNWMSASIISFAVAAVATVPAALLRRRRVPVC